MSWELSVLAVGDDDDEKEMVQRRWMRRGEVLGPLRLRLDGGF